MANVLVRNCSGQGSTLAPHRVKDSLRTLFQSLRPHPFMGLVEVGGGERGGRAQHFTKTINRGQNEDGI